MALQLDGPNEEALRRFIRDSIGGRRNLLGRGYQASLYVWREVEPSRVVKAATGCGPVLWVRSWMLRREHRAYGRLAGVSGIPRCFGFVDGRYLVLEYIDGVPRTSAAVEDTGAFFAELFSLIDEMHRRGVAHGDIQKRDNLLVVGGRHPCVLDFGAAVVRAEGFSPLNHWLFRFLARLDWNTWVKLKYGGRVGEASEADLAHYHRTWIENAARAVKRAYTAPRRWWRRRRGGR